MVYLTKKVRFSASHVLKQPKGKDLPHGHNYTLEVTVRGEPDPKSGLLIDFDRLGDAIEKKVLSKVNYKHLDETTPFLEGKAPTAENLVKTFWKGLEHSFPEGTLVEIRLHQGDGETAAYRGE